MPPKILIAGYFGFGNIGDEAILSATMQSLRRLRPGLEFCVVSGNPDNTQRLHGVSAVKWNDLPGIIQNARECDLLILGGGGIFHDYWGVGSEPLLNTLAAGTDFYGIPVLANLLGKPLMIYSVGIGPLKTDAGKNLTRQSIELADQVTVRDPESKSLIQTLGIPADRIVVTADPGFDFPVDARPADDILNQLKIDTRRPVVGVCLRNWDLSSEPRLWQSQVAAGLDYFIESTPCSLLFIPFHYMEGYDPADDAAAAKGIIARMSNSDQAVLLNGEYRADIVAGVIAHCDLVLGMRLHSVIFAAMAGVPVVALEYDPKVKQMMDRLCMCDYSLDLAGLTSQALLASLELAWKNRLELKEKLAGKTGQLKNLAEDNARLAIQLLDAGTGKPPRTGITGFSREFAIERSLLAFEKTKEASALSEQVNALSAEFSAQVAEKDRIVDEQAGSLQRLTKQLADITGSRGWKLIWGLWQVRLFMVPKGSRREILIGKVWHGTIGVIDTSIRSTGRAIKRFFRAHSIRMSGSAYAFHLYKRARASVISSDFHDLQVPGVAGLVSIVLPVYNGAGMVQEALDRILDQTYSNFELIAIDDGSQDDTPRILDEYAARDKRIRVVHQENKKLPATINRGFNLARGEFLTWTSHDNRFKPGYLKKMVACLQKHPAWDMTYANIDIIGEDGSPLHRSTWFGGYQKPYGSEHIHLPTDTGELNTVPNNFIGGAFLYRARVHWLIGDYNPLQYTREDYDYWMRVNSLLTLKHADFTKPPYEYRFHSSSLTNKDDELGITRDRKYLMVFDDFRRDFALMPLVWLIDAERNDDAHTGKVIESLRHTLIRAGQIVEDYPHSEQAQLPSLWIPRIYLKITSTPDRAISCPPLVEPNAIKILLCISDEQLPDKMDAVWDICLAHGPQLSPPKLSTDQQGWLVSRDIRTLFAAMDIQVRSRQLRSMEKHIAEPGSTGIKITVIICVYQGDWGLEKALHAISHQTMAHQDYEVLVVDNNPEGVKSASLIDRLRSDEFDDFPGHLRLLYCPISGLSYARNAGIAEAGGELVLFLDDDAIARDDLLENYWSAFFDHPEAGVIGGHIVLELPAELSIPWKHGWERYWSQFVTNHPGYTTVENWWDFPWGANWCAKRQALLQVGGFRGKYGRRGNDYYGGEEIVAANQIKSLGYSVGVLPQAVVLHRVDPDRFTLEHIKQTIRAGVFAQYQAQISLHLPKNRSAGGDTRKILAGLRDMTCSLLIKKEPKDRTGPLEISASLGAHLELFWRKIIDNFQRVHIHR